jgi:endo-alpha-1,4-polygalactosaminidase (GH114 family)
MDVRRLKGKSICALFLGALLCLAMPAEAPVQNWTNYVRIGAYGLKPGNAEAIVRDAQNSLVYGIEVDNDIPGRYESFLDPAEKLKAISDVAQAAHRVGNKAFVYIAGTECITAHADKVAHSMMKDHPDWIQRNITGEPAMFTAKAAFWIREGDEDVWVSPYAKEWRKVYMERVRQIAGTGIDGIYVDIPYWMTHFEGWENTWASFDDATVAAFRAKTGLDAKHDLKLGDFKDANFRKWVDFRIDTMTDFMRDIRENARGVSPQISVIPEIYPGIEQEATRVGADVYQMYAVVDAIAHEYEFGEGEHMAASRSQMQWFLYQAGMLSFRAFAQGKATWILNYSWDGDRGVDKREAMKNLAASIVMDGANFWDAPGHVMGGSNDTATRKEIFAWIAKNEKELYLPRLPIQPVGVYFSPKSRDYDAENFLPSYRGTLVALLQAHRELQVVTPRTLEEFRGKVLVLPEVSVLNDAEKRSLKRFTDGSGRLVVLGTNASGAAAGAETALADDPAREYFHALERDFAAASKQPPETLLRALMANSDIEVETPSTVAANFGMVNGAPHIFLANFTGLVPSKVAVPTTVNGIRVTIPADRGATLTFVPFLGEAQTVRGEKKGDKVEFVLPAVERGAIVWIGAQN